MPESRIPDPTLMARLQLSVKGVDWAASLVRGHQHEIPPGHEWSPHQHLVHLLEVETGNYHVRLERMLGEETPRLEPRVMEARPDLEALDIDELAGRSGEDVRGIQGPRAGTVVARSDVAGRH